jgi:hypothetical protein
VLERLGGERLGQFTGGHCAAERRRLPGPHRREIPRACGLGDVTDAPLATAVAAELPPLANAGRTAGPSRTWAIAALCVSLVGWGAVALFAIAFVASVARN